MSPTPYLTLFAPVLQVASPVLTAWEQCVRDSLPATLEAQARALGAWQRTRKLPNAATLLRGLLVYALPKTSFRFLCAWGSLLDLGSLTEKAWRQRFARAHAWIAWLLRAQVAAGQAALWAGQGQAERVLLIDATRLRTVGGTGDDLRVHLAYDLLAGQLAQVLVSERYQAESVQWTEARPGDIYVGDRMYGRASTLIWLAEQGAAGVVRIQVKGVRLETAAGKRLNLGTALADVPPGQTRQVRCWVRDAAGEERREVRLVALHYPTQTADTARQRRAAAARKKGRAVRPGPQYWAGWLLLLTTLPHATWTVGEVLRLYRARWQIELLFKRFKGHLHQCRVPFQGQERAQTYVHLQLLLWTLQDAHLQDLRTLLGQVAQTPVGALPQPDTREQARQESTWGLIQLTLGALRQALLGWWPPQRLRECWPEVRKIFTYRPRARGQQESEVRDWLGARQARRASP